MASIINASTSGVGGVITTADSSGDLNIQSGGATVAAVTSAGVAITGTLSASGVITGDGSGLTNLPATIPDALSTASGSAPSYSARAWVNFNGTGTVAIRASGNVSSITDHGTGNYSINFTNAMPDALFSVNGTGSQNNTYNCIVATNDKTYSNSTSLARILVIQVNNAPVDVAYLNITIHR